MAGYRSENNKFPNKENYKDLNLSIWPNKIDTRDTNLNMKGFVNIGEGQVPDYVMAEFVNAALDGVMGLQRALGETPMVPFDAVPAQKITIVENETVDTRITRIEDGLFDERYGGKGWTNIPTRPTLNNHNHSGIKGQPPKINLTSEVSGKLPKINIDFSQATGMTGADVFLSNTDSTLISVAVNDRLSMKTGGVLNGDVVFNKLIQTSTTREWNNTNLVSNTNATKTTDNGANTNSTLTSHATNLSVLLNSPLTNLFYGKYVLGIRVRSSSIADTDLMRVRLGSANIQIYKGIEFEKVIEYKMFYYVFDHTSASKDSNIVIEKLGTAVGMNVSLDSAFIQPIHPGTLDR